MTNYLVLAQTERDGDTWETVGYFSAHNPEAAVRAAAETSPDSFHRFVAVPARSWKPMTASVETVTKIKIGAATDSTETKP